MMIYHATNRFHQKHTGKFILSLLKYYSSFYTTQTHNPKRNLFKFSHSFIHFFQKITSAIFFCVMPTYYYCKLFFETFETVTVSQQKLYACQLPAYIHSLRWRLSLTANTVLQNGDKLINKLLTGKKCHSAKCTIAKFHYKQRSVTSTKRRTKNVVVWDSQSYWWFMSLNSIYHPHLT